MYWAISVEDKLQLKMYLAINLEDKFAKYQLRLL